MSSPTASTGAMMRPVMSRLKQRGGSSRPKKLPDPINVWKIVRGDKVQVIAGKEEGKQGTIIKVKKHVKKSQDQQKQGDQSKGRIITKEAPIHYSNVALLDPVQNVPTKVRFGFLEDGTKVRISKKSGAIIPKPEPKKRMYPVGTSETDTSPTAAQRVTVSAADAALHDALRKLTIVGNRRASPPAEPTAASQPSSA